MNILRSLNFFNVTLSYLASSIIHKPVMRGMPPFLSFELTNFCNLSCPECSSGAGMMKRGKGFMDINIYEDLMKEVDKYLINSTLYFQGEPMLHPDFFSFIEKSRKTFTTVSTNGHFLTEKNSERIMRSGLRKLIISLDGLDQETYSAYRINGNLQTVLDGIKNIGEARRKSGSDISIVIQFLVNSFNEPQLPEIRKFTKAHKMTLSLKSMQIAHDEETGWLPADEKYRRYSISGGKLRIKSDLPNRCARLWFNPVITWDGMVVPCCFDKDAEYVMGDLRENTFKEIWNGPLYGKFRSEVLKGRGKTDICRNCTSGMRGVRT